MENVHQNEPIEVEFTEEEREINGKPLYYNTSQVAVLLSDDDNPVNDSTVRYWCEQFKEFLDIKRSGRNRKFTEKNIEELRFIKKLLREDNLTIEQVAEYLSNRNPETLNQSLVEQDPLAAKVVAQALLEGVNAELQSMRELIISEVVMDVENIIDKHSKVYKEENDKLKAQIEELTDKLNTTLIEQEERAMKRDADVVKSLKELQEQRQKQYEEQNNKGFFSRLFRK